MKICITNGKVILKDKIVESNLFIENGTITEISKRKPNNEKSIDANGQYVSPGFVDVHSHGRHGSDFMYPTFEDVNTISKHSLHSGVTSILATTMTMSIKDTNKAIENLYQIKDRVEGSKLLGVHMEGPFFNKKFKGAQPEEYMIDPTIENFKALVGDEKYIPFVKKLSLAPELEGAITLIEYLTKVGVTTSIGHTDASYQEAMQGIEAGVTSGTHTFNAMTPLTHRMPGVVGAIMNDERVYAELILDGIHVAYPAANVLVKVKGEDKVVLITDSMEAAGLKEGKYSLGNQAVFVDATSARLESGALAGSILSLNKAVKHAYQNLNLSLPVAVKFASLNPATSINEYTIGEIAVNKVADIIFFNEDIDVSFAMINGKVVFGG